MKFNFGVLFFITCISCDGISPLSNVTPGSFEALEGLSIDILTTDTLANGVGGFSRGLCQNIEERNELDIGTFGADGCTFEESGAIEPLNPEALDLDQRIRNILQFRLTNHGIKHFNDNFFAINNSLSNDELGIQEIPISVNTDITDLFFENSEIQEVVACPNGITSCSIKIQPEKFDIKLNRNKNSIEIETNVSIGNGVQFLVPDENCKKEPRVKNLCYAANDCVSCAGNNGLLNIRVNPGTPTETDCALVIAGEDLKTRVELEFSIPSNTDNNLKMNALDVDLFLLHNTRQFNLDAGIFNPGRENPSGLCQKLRQKLRQERVALVVGKLAAGGLALKLKKLALLVGFWKGLVTVFDLPEFFSAAIGNPVEDRLQERLPKSLGVADRIILNDITAIDTDADKPTDLPAVLAKASFDGTVQERACSETSEELVCHRNDGTPLFRSDEMANAIEYGVSLGSYANVEGTTNGDRFQGISLGTRGGILVDDIDEIGPDVDPFFTCAGDVSQFSPPVIGGEVPFLNSERAVGVPNALLRNENPLGEPYDFAVGISEGMLRQLGYVLFRSGLLCMHDVGVLPTGNIINKFLSSSLGIIPSVGQLSPAPVPITFTIRPRGPLDFDFSTFVNQSVLIELIFENFEVDVNILLNPGTPDELPQKLFTFLLNGRIPIFLSTLNTVTEDGKVIPNLKLDPVPFLDANLFPLKAELVRLDLPQPLRSFCRTASLTDPAAMQCYSRLLDGLPIGNPDAPQVLLDAVPLLVATYFDHIDDLGFLSFALPADGLFGIAPDKTRLIKLPSPNAVVNVAGQSITVPGSEEVILSAFFSFAEATGSAAKAEESVPVETKVRLIKEDGRYDPNKRVFPGVELEVFGNEDNLEWQARVDGGIWSPFFQTPSAILREPRLLATKEHHIEVRAQIKGRPETLDKTPDMLFVESQLTKVSAEETTNQEVAGCGVSPVGSRYGWVVFLLFGMVLSFSRRNRFPFFLLIGCLFFTGCGLFSENKSQIACQVDNDCNALSCEAGPVVCNQELICECPVSVPLGDIGKFVDIASDGETAVIAAYNSTYGDLVLTRVVPPQQPTEFLFVDGVPDGPVVGNPNGPRGGIADKGQDAGKSVSIAVDAFGNAHIAYQDVSKHTLKYARVNREGTEITKIDIDGNGEQVALYTDIALDSDGVPQIAYMVIKSNSPYSSEVRFVRSNVSLPTSRGDFRNAQIVQERVGNFVSAPDRLAKGIGLYVSLQIDANKRAHMSYFDSTSLDLLQASENANETFVITKIDVNTNQSDAGAFGKFSSMVLDPNAESLRFQYALMGDGDLIFIDHTNLPVEKIDDGARTISGVFTRHRVGNGKMGVGVRNGSNIMYVAYQDSFTQNVLLAYRKRAHSWARTILAGEEVPRSGSRGFAMAVATSTADPSVVFVVNYLLNDPLQNHTNHLEVLSQDLDSLP
jgi:hypothetical protein